MSLNNFFVCKKKKEAQQEEDKKQNYETYQKQQNEKNNKRVQLTAARQHRLENFCDTMFSQQYIQSMEKGSIPLKHPIHHDFRDRDRKLEMDKTGGITVKTFLDAKKRAETAQEDFRSKHLQNDLFNPHMPYKRHDHWLRVDDKTKENEPLRFGLNQRNENTRLREEINEINSKIDINQRQMKMVHFPDWKEPQKEKWMDQKTFDLYICKYQGIKSKEPWTQFPLNEDNQNNQYIDGYEVTGDLTRKPKLKKTDDFCATIRNDPTGTTLGYSNSLRTFKQDQALNTQAGFDLYSQNNHLKHYKSSLVKTKSVDRIAPQCHSNNYKGQAFQNLRPQKQGKLYIKSIDHHGQTLIMKKQVKPTTTQSEQQLQQNNQTDEQTQGQLKPSTLAKIQEFPNQNQQTLSNVGAFTPLEKVRKVQGRKSLISGDDFEIEGLGYPYNQVDDEGTKVMVDKYFKN